MRKILAIVAAAGAVILGAIGLGASPASAAPCIVPFIVDADNPQLGWAPDQWSGTVNGQQRSVCYNVGLEGPHTGRYYKFRVYVQDLVDYPPRDLQNDVCVYYSTPGTTAWRLATCSTDSANWTTRTFSLVVDRWASGNAAGYKWYVHVEENNIWKTVDNQYLAGF